MPAFEFIGEGVGALSPGLGFGFSLIIQNVSYLELFLILAAKQCVEYSNSILSFLIKSLLGNVILNCSSAKKSSFIPHLNYNPKLKCWARSGGFIPVFSWTVSLHMPYRNINESTALLHSWVILICNNAGEYLGGLGPKLLPCTM